MTGLMMKDALVMRKTLRLYALFLLFYSGLAVLGVFPMSVALAMVEVIVMVLLGQFEDRFTAFEVMTGNNARVIKLVQHAINGGQTNLFTHVDKTFIEVFRTDMVVVWTLKHFEDF